MARERGAVPADAQRKLLDADRRATEAAAELREDAAAAHAAGESIRELAALLGRSATTIQAWVKAEG